MKKKVKKAEILLFSPVPTLICQLINNHNLNKETANCKANKIIIYRSLEDHIY